MSAKSDAAVQAGYEYACQKYAELDVDVAAALKALAGVSISLQCWQGDDVAGFESSAGLSGGGILATGGYPGRARTPDELRTDLDKALSLIPGTHRVNLHAIYAETPGPVERNELVPEHFAGWMDWAAGRGLGGLDFNPTFFSHPLAADGFTLASRDEGVRKFWIEHGQACRRIASAMGRKLGSPSVCNVWIPDGMKDTPADRATPRRLLHQSLDAVLAEPLPADWLLDSVESKLFGIGSESYVVGSHEFYLLYAAARGCLLCLDSGHFHPTEVISDKVSAVLEFLPGLLLHVSRGVRWDSDHVVVLSDELRALAGELVGGGYLDRVHVGLDYFDASINRVAAWVVGTRAMLQALLAALLEPRRLIRHLESAGDYTARLAMQETAKALPFGAVWDYYCTAHNVPPAAAWLDDVKAHERSVLAQRGA